MSDKKKPGKETQLTETIQRVVSIDGKDWFLQELVNYANKFGLSFSITLTVGGAIVCGRIISGKEYFDLFSAQFCAPLEENTPEAVGIFTELFENHGKIYDDKEAMEPPNYIHLKNAHIIQAKSRLPASIESDMLWRARIDGVEGFMLGEFDSAEL
jgi:hypothetical protein